MKWWYRLRNERYVRSLMLRFWFEKTYGAETMQRARKSFRDEIK